MKTEAEINKSLATMRQLTDAAARDALEAVIQTFLSKHEGCSFAARNLRKAAAKLDRDGTTYGPLLASLGGSYGLNDRFIVNTLRLKVNDLASASPC